VSSHLASALLEVLFPGHCLLCGASLLNAERPTEAAGHFTPVCRSCLESLRPLQGRRCRRCSAPLISASEVCTRCRTRSYHFHDNLSLFAYRDAVKELLYQYKFKQRRRVAPLLANFLAAAYWEHFSGLALVPVPGRRALDHIERICRILERKHDVPVRRLLSRRGGVPQKSLDYARRCLNIRGTIACQRRGPPPAAEVVLLDDVFTSGATASECARVLLSGGVESVRVLTIALD
jgi:ComF family protein